MKKGTLKVNATTPRGRHAIHIASMNNQVSAIRWLLAQGVDVNVLDAKGRHSVHFAAACGHLQVIQFFHYEHNVPIDVSDGNGRNMTWYAVGGADALV